MAELAEFEIALSPSPSETRVMLNGNDISSQVYGLSIAKEEPFDFPVVILAVRAGKIDVSGQAGVAVSLGQSVDEFLEGIDADELTREALGAGLGTKPIHAALDILKAKAHDAPA